MKEKWAKLFIAFVLFAIGANLTMSATRAVEGLWLLIPGIPILAIGAGASAYYYAKLRSGYKRQSDEDIIKQAKLDVKSTGGSDGKK